jgi:hypothetical protein
MAKDKGQKGVSVIEILLAGGAGRRALLGVYKLADSLAGRPKDSWFRGLKGATSWKHACVGREHRVYVISCLQSRTAAA